MKINQKIKTTSRGFTLIEILTVLAIIGILTAILIPAVSKAQARARLTSAVAEINSARTAAVEAAARMGGTLPITEAATGPTVASGTPGTASYVPATLGVGFAATDFTADHQELTGSTTIATNFNNSVRLDHVLISMQPAILDTMFTSKFAGSKVAKWTKNANVPTWDTANMVWKISGGTRDAPPAGSPAGTLGAFPNWGDGTSQAGTSRMECAVNNANFDVSSATAANQVVNTAGGINFKLDGVTSLPDGRVAYIIYKDVPVNDAYALAKELNGSSLMDDIIDGTRASQKRGRVVYNMSDTKTVTDVFVYLAVF